MSTPLVGIEVDLEASAQGRRYAKCYEAYFDAVVAAGGAPVLLAPCPEPALRRVLGSVQAVIVPGGDDFSAEEWGEEQRPCARYVPSDARRLAQGRLLLSLVEEARLPYLGVCYGAQLLSLVRGGALVQDIPDGVPEALDHRAPHEVEAEAMSLLAALSGESRFQINSRHHQAVREPGRGLRIAARAPDGVVEAVEGTEPGRFCLGVQWHPEELGATPGGAPLFEGLVTSAWSAA